MNPCYASSVHDSFAAVVGCKQPENDPIVELEIPENRVVDDSIPENVRMVGAFPSGSEEAGKAVVKSLAAKGSEIITKPHIDAAFAALGCPIGAGSLLSVVQHNKLFAIQSAGSNSILRCSHLGQIVNGLETIPRSKNDAPGCAVLDLESKDSFVILGATQLLEDFSQARLTKIFAENIENGTSGVASALLNHTASIDIAETVNVIVLDVRGWVASHGSGAKAAKDSADDEGAVGSEPVSDPNATATAPSAAGVESGVANAAGGVNDATKSTQDIPASQDVAAGVATAAGGVKEGAVDTKGEAATKGETGTKDGPKEEEVDPNAPWHTKMIGTAKKHWSTHKVAIMKFAKTRKRTANKDAKKLQGFFGKCGGGGKDSVLHEEDVSIPVPTIPSDAMSEHAT